MVIISLLWNVGHTAQALRGCTGCMAHGLSFQEREFQEPKEVPHAPRWRRGRSRRARSRSCPSRPRTHLLGGGNRRSPGGRNSRSYAHFCGQAVQNLCFVWVQDIEVGAETGSPRNLKKISRIRRPITL